MKATKKGTPLKLRKIQGQDYLDVQQRVLWFREEHPDWSIVTEFISITEKDAMAKAVITDDKGFVIATGHKYEDVQGFKDYREKCETGAIGRALALCGYGTQFAHELNEGERIVDAPAPASDSNDSSEMQQQSGPQESAHYSGNSFISEKQVKRLWAIAYKNAWTKDAIITHLKSLGYTSTDTIPFTKYETVVSFFQNNRPAV